MHAAVLSLLTALVATLLLLRLGGRVGGRVRQAQPGARAKAAPISGLAAMVGLCAGWLCLAPLSGDPGTANTSAVLLAVLPCAALPIFGLGLVADFWRPVPLWLRACLTWLAAALTVCLAQAIAPVAAQTVAGPASALVWPGAPGLVLALAFITSVTHAMAVVDRRNGAAAMCVLLIQAALACVAYEVGDRALMAAALVVVGAVLGLSFFSFQANLACLGRSGCALLGFVTAALSALLVLRNPSVSLWLPVLLCAHPVLEALFAWWRLREGAALQEGPSLLYLQVVRWATGNPADRRQALGDNAMAPHLWMLCIVGITPAVLWWQDSGALVAAIVVRLAVQAGVAKLLAGAGPRPPATAP
jgi:UDP-N-acetylmuramyl pentapeptide phosphotransferase/UDP-N-acetylglucosamine-1-phosphate transferase